LIEKLVVTEQAKVWRGIASARRGEEPLARFAWKERLCRLCQVY
jgi:hypothetical protein